VLLLVVSAVCWHSYSYSEDYIYGSSGNAAQNGLNWVMGNVLPAYTGLQVNGVVYQYTTIKELESEMLVTVQNEDAQNPGQYIFRETDDWTGLPGNTIRKAYPQAYIDNTRWGDGSIVVEGEGEVTEASVIYTYRYNPECAENPQTKPECPGFVIPDIPVPDPVDPLDDDIIQDEIDRERVATDEDEEEEDRARIVNRKDKRRDMLEKMLGTTNTTELAGSSQVLHEELLALDVVPTQYLYTLPVTTYEETVTLQDSELPDNAEGRRANFAQQLLHERLVDLQYQN
jgi:hypothetical protein